MRPLVARRAGGDGLRRATCCCAPSCTSRRRASTRWSRRTGCSTRGASCSRSSRASAAWCDGASVNDAVLAVCAGGLRRYLDGHAELPEADPDAERAVCRAAAAVGDAAGRWLRVSSARHRRPGAAAASSTRRRHRRPRPSGWRCELPTRSTPGGHAGAHRQDARPRGSAPARAPPQLHHHATCPARRCPLYLHGARMTYFSAILPIADGMGLVFAVTELRRADRRLADLVPRADARPAGVHAVRARQLPGVPGAGPRRAAGQA